MIPAKRNARPYIAFAETAFDSRDVTPQRENIFRNCHVTPKGQMGRYYAKHLHLYSNIVASALSGYHSLQEYFMFAFLLDNGSAQVYVASQHRIMDKHGGICCFEGSRQPSKWEGSAMAIFYIKVNIIGRSSGRSAIGAATYRRSAKMQSIAHAAYQRGEKIYEKGDKITHDYRSKSGVVHSEIMLPDGAPSEFMDAQTLWNAVETSEKRKDAQLAREIIVALPREFDLQEQIEIMREYVKTNFVNKGMIAVFSIHNKGDDNPHAHISSPRYL